MYVYGTFLLNDDGSAVAQFSSHWAACAAMIRLSDPPFRSLGGDKESDLATERLMCVPPEREGADA
jgi:hypothetical protein